MEVERVTLKPEEAAQAVGISPRTLADWTAAGFVPSIKRGGIRLYSVDALRRWAEEASAYEEAGHASKVGSRVDLQAKWGQKVGRGGSRTPRPIRPHRTRGEDAAG